MYFKIKLADMVIGIRCMYDTLKAYCGEYVTEDGEPDFEIEISRENILAEISQTEGEHSMQYLETLAALRKISGELPDRDRFLMHGAIISYEGKGYMFTAPSGTGKSTHIDLWKKYLGEAAVIINGDKPIITANKYEIYGYGTPWAGKEGWQTNQRIILNGICFLCRGTENHIRRLNPAEALPMLLRQVYYTDDPEKAGKTMELLNRIFENVPMYQLSCDISEEAVRCSFETLTGENFDQRRKTRTWQEEEVWMELVRLQGEKFSTVKGLEFCYKINGNEILIDRKKKSITRSSVDIALEKIRELEGNVSGPKKLQVFGASYLYSIFRRMGLITSDKS